MYCYVAAAAAAAAAAASGLLLLPSKHLSRPYASSGVSQGPWQRHPMPEEVEGFTHQRFDMTG